MIRRHLFVCAVMMALPWMDSSALFAQGYVQADLPLVAPGTSAATAARYYDGKSPVITETLPPPVGYRSSPGCAPLLPTIAEGLRNTLNCLLPCRGGSRPLGIGGSLLGRRGGLFSVRFYDGCGCGVPVPQCGCGIRIIEGHHGIPTPAEGIPQVNPPKPVPDSSAIYYNRPANRAILPASYPPRQFRDASQGVVPAGASPSIRQANYYRTSPIPNPLRP